MDVKENHQMSAEDERRHWWIRTRFFHLRRAAAQALVNFGSIQVLEVGCGTAQNLHYLRKDFRDSAKLPRLVGVEPALSDPSLRLSWMSQDDIIIRSIEELKGQFDFLIAMDVLEHTDHGVTALRTWQKHLKPGGLIFITVPAFGFLWSNHDEFLGHKRRYTKQLLAEEARQAGLEPIKLSYIFSYLLPVIFLVRRLLPRNPNSLKSDLIKPNLAMNALLTVIGKAESLFGGNPLFGTSIVGLFRKKTS